MIELDLRMGCLSFVDEDGIFTGSKEPVKVGKVVAFLNDTGEAQLMDDSLCFFPQHTVTTDVVGGLPTLLKEKEAALKILGAKQVYCIHRIRPYNVIQDDAIVAQSCNVTMFGTDKKQKSISPKMTPELQKQLAHDEEMYGNAFVELKNGRWKRIDPTTVAIKRSRTLEKMI